MFTVDVKQQYNQPTDFPYALMRPKATNEMADSGVPDQTVPLRSSLIRDYTVYTALSISILRTFTVYAQIVRLRRPFWPVRSFHF